MARLREFRIAFLQGRPDNALVFAMLSRTGELGTRTFPIGKRK